jgi:hypothetical protein
MYLPGHHVGTDTEEMTLISRALQITTRYLLRKSEYICWILHPEVVHYSDLRVGYNYALF